MTIQLLEQQEYLKLLDIFKNNPSLTFQNEGYKYIDKNKLTDDDIAKISQIEEILKKSISGFQKFNNFKLNRKNEPQIRFQYDWNFDQEVKSIPFIGVGYLLIDELLNGFKTQKT